MADIKAELQAQLKKMEAAMAAGKQDEIINFYTNDCRLLPPGAPMVVGEDAIKAFFSAKCMAQFAEKIGKFEGTVVDAVSMGDHATSVNTTVACDKDGKVVDNGKSVSLWKKIDGNWRVHWSLWNHDNPAPPLQ